MSSNKSSIIRLAKDVKSIIRNPLENNNIYYKHDDENIYKGYALIIGSKTTPYELGYYFFELNYPTNYPFEPPVVIFKTCDGLTRFNPNLYINGKVCLSILNTWSGEGWSSCQTISSILLILSSILNSNPLTNEPGIKITNLDNDNYNNLLTYKNIEFSIIKQIEYLNDDLNTTLKNFKQFQSIINKKFLENRDQIIENLNKIKHLDKQTIKVNVYNLNQFIDLDKLKIELNKLNKEIKINMLKLIC